MDTLAQRICEITIRAGEEIKKIRSNFLNHDISTKADGSPVTEADIEANRIIVEGLSSLRPDWPIISEEGSVNDENNASEFAFLVDPLDGTKEYIKGTGMYTVNIAVMKINERGRWDPILGAVRAPEYNLTWCGGETVNPFISDSRGTRSIRAGSDRVVPIIVGSVSHSTPNDLAFRKLIGEHVFEGIGSSMKICRVADGSADIYPRFGTTSCWDTAAAHAILKSAGGTIVNTMGIELDYDIVDSILNPWFVATSSSQLIETWLDNQRN